MNRHVSIWMDICNLKESSVMILIQNIPYLPEERQQRNCIKPKWTIKIHEGSSYMER